MPKRGVVAIVLTTGALVLLLSFKTPDAIDPTVGADAAVTAAVASPPPAAMAAPTSAPTLPGGQTLPGAQAPQDAPALPAPAATADPTPPPVAAAPTMVPTAQPTQAPAAATDGTILGDAVRIRWGTVQVQVTVSDGRITDVVAVQLPDHDPRSSRISSYAEPALRESALTSQSASIDIVSGATFTSRAYAQSLQSALDQARAQG